MPDITTPLENSEKCTAITSANRNSSYQSYFLSCNLGITNYQISSVLLLFDYALTDLILGVFLANGVQDMIPHKDNTFLNCSQTFRT